MKTWTDDALATLRRMLRAGETYSAIAAAIGVSRNAVIGKASRLGLSGSAARAPDGSVAASVTGERRTGTVKAWTADEVDTLRTLAFRQTAAQIGVALGRSAGAIRAKADSLGIVLRPGERRPPGTGGRKATARPASTALVAVAEVAPAEAVPAGGVRFLDRRAFQCAAIVDGAAPILERMVCGRRVSGATAWCAEHRLRFTTRGMAA